MKGFKRIIPSFMAFAMACTIFALPVGAEYQTSTTDTFWASYIRKGVDSTQSVPIIGKMVGYLVANTSGRVCGASEDQLHHADSYEACAIGKDGTPYVSCICKYCGDRFKALASDLSTAYDDYVQTIPISNYASDGSLLYTLPTLDYFLVGAWDDGFQWVGCPHVPPTIPNPDDGVLVARAQYFFNCDTGIIQIVPASGFSGFEKAGPCRYSFSGKAPVSGYYTLLAGPAIQFVSSYEYRGELLTRIDTEDYSKGTSYVYSQSTEITCIFRSHSFGTFLKYSTVSCAPPVYKVVPLDSVVNQVNNIYNINTRPTSIQGGNYGIIGDNGQITKVEDNSTIINETNNTYYNPATGQTAPITNWTYDYSDRSYKVTLEGGKTSNVTYGDEHISIVETTVNESGDTITNNYTIYYLVDGSGNPTDPPAACEHTWAETGSTPATCTVPGSKTLTCSKCHQAKKESVPALGHDWQVKQTVTTEYDDTGQLVQQGYTIFECSRCHEQRRSDDGTVPPGGGSGTDPGEGDDGESIWDKLGNLLGSILGGLIGMVEAVLGKILDALTALAEMLMEKVTVVIETILSLFEELPKLFGGFLAFLTALFPFLPPEIMTLLTFGVVAVVFIGILKAVRR